MAQQQVASSGGLAALACYTVDTDSGSEAEGESKDFGDLRIKEEPVWEVDTAGHTEPQDMVEFTKRQIKVEIVSEDEEDSSDSSDSSDEEDKVEEKKVEEVEKDEGPPKTKNELGLADLPAVEELDVTVRLEEGQVVGTVSSTVELLLVIESLPDMPALDLDSVLFARVGESEELAAIGRVFDVIGPVNRPFYCVRYNTREHVTSKGLVTGQQIYFAPKTEHTSFVFLEQLMKMKISDASWCNDEELPPEFQDYSDDEQETKAKQNKKIAKMVEKGADPATVQSKRARMDAGRVRQEQRGPRPPRHDPRVNNSLYSSPAVNPFYRQQRTYDPRAMGGGIRWGNFGPPQQQQQQQQYGAPAYAQPPQPYHQGPPAHPVHQYHQATLPTYSPYSVPPPPLPAPVVQAALQGSWAQYAPPRHSWAPPPPPPE